MYEFPFELDDFQKDACNYIDNGKSVVVCAPTGAGKTVIAQHAIHRALEEGTRIFYTTPLKALSNQKFYDFSEKYGSDKVGLLTGDTSINRNAQIVIMTTEVFRNMLYGTNFGAVADNMKDVKYVVLDEVHYMNDEQRGTVWEESIIYCPTNVQIIALSATVANADELTGWINTVHSKTELVDTNFRPVPLRFFYFDSSQPDKLLPLLTPSGQLNKKIKPEKKLWGHNRKKQRSFVKDIVRNLYNQDMLPAIYFTFSRKKCDEQMEKCAGLELVTKGERAQIRQFIDDYIAENPHLYNNKHIEYLLCGVASHHAGLLPAWKNLVEKLFQKGLIKVVFATETLAAGINMPARSTVISSTSKRTDSGHRMLTASEFLQMSGRAGRRGMDEIGYVTVVGTQFESPEEVAELVLSDANPLESRFSPSYSMVLNLLQRFSLEEAKELILKSFGYFSSGSRLKPLLQLKSSLEGEIKTRDFVCPNKLCDAELHEYDKLRHIYVQNRQTYKKITKQERSKNRPLSPEVVKFGKETKAMLEKMHAYPCDTCKLYKKHTKNIEVISRFKSKLNKLDKEIERQRDIFWNKFLAHRSVLIDFGYLKDDYPTDRGVTTSQIRSENELFVAEIIFSHVLENLTPAQLAAVVCAITTEDLRIDIPYIPFSEPVRKTLNSIRNIKRKIEKVQNYYSVEAPLYINPYFSSLIELWVEGADWETISQQIDIGEGDIVRSFKRVVDVLRQFTTISNVPEALVFTAREAIEKIMREPVDID
ncbi:TPA: DEAD/DEAH box helicase [Candidatus Scatousia excrementigallinarum]|uniref:DEAD/DEAH box helicase n=1 Tax=Candidatus Scatousia excrementigallinarum TaxID=2840935 RepID=A0A9D1F0X0_9BACT|nr:DEAD/DEAH box helicase [Candidatus Scatousia excrementigallinarum]